MRKSKIIKTQGEHKCKANNGRRAFLFFTFFVLLGFISFIVFRMSHQAEKQNGINDEIAKLQIQANKLEGENQDLKEMIDYLKTDDFREKEAKDKLNLIKEGEQMILVKEDSLNSEIISEKKTKETELIVHRGNYYYWWHYFFSIK